MSDMQIPRTAFFIKGDKGEERKIPVYRYKLLISPQAANIFAIYEEVQVEESGLTGMYTLTGKQTFFSDDDFFEFYSLLRKNELNYFNYKKFDRKNPTTEKYIKACHESALAFCKSKLHINLENAFYADETYFILNFKNIEDLLSGNTFNNISPIEFERMIKSFFEANLIIDYIPLGTERNIKTLKEYTISEKSVIEYTCSNLYDVFFAVLHYYKISGYKLKMCKLCHSLFFADNKKEEYCKNPFTYTDWENKEHCYPQCSGKIGARKKIWDKLQAKKIKVSKWLENHPNAKEKFDVDCYNIETKARDNPCIENLKEFEKFLYVDCSKYHKKYERSV